MYSLEGRKHLLLSWKVLHGGIVLFFKNKISQVLAIENLVLDPDPTLDYPNSLDPNSDLKSKDPKHWFPVPYCLLGFNDCRERLLIQKKSQRSVKFQGKKILEILAYIN
jgi:hypothetical protein